MVEFQIDFKRPKGTRNFQELFEEAMDNFIRKVADEILRHAVNNLDRTREDGYITSNTGRLAQSGRVEKLKDAEYQVLFEAIYGAWVEFGTFPHFAPLGVSLKHRTLKSGKNKGKLIITSLPDPTTNPLDWWAWRRGVRDGVHAWDNGKYRGVHTSLGWGLWLKIKELGTDPHPFLRPAIAQVQAQLSQIATEFGLEFVGEFVSE